MFDKRFVLLNDGDNVLVCCSRVTAGESVVLKGESVTLEDDIQVGHKIARVNIAKGDRIIKYGAPIGSATADIAFARHVHLHNMKSDYIPSHTRENRGGAE